MSTTLMIRLLLGVLVGLLPAVFVMVWLDENDWQLPDPWGRFVPLPDPFDGRWSGTATLLDSRGTPNCVWAPDIVLIVSGRGSQAKLGLSYSSTRPRTGRVSSCPAHSSVTEHPVETSRSGALGFQDSGGNTWSLVRERTSLGGEVAPSSPGRPGAFYGDDVYLSQDLEGRDPRAPFRLMIMLIAITIGALVVNGLARLRVRQ